MRPMGPAAPAVAAAIGLVGGWLVRPVAAATGVTAPLVPWGSVLVLGVVAGVLGLAAWATRTVIADPRARLEPHQAVNRLLLARACVVVGSLVAGAYAGYALSWVGLPTELAQQRLTRSGVAALASVAVVVAAALLERACRVRSDEPDA
ncbi:DUF3180 family protein [Nocardioides lentus]